MAPAQAAVASSPARSPAASSPGGRSPSIATLLGIVVTLWGAFLGARPLFDNSFFTHLTTGRDILERSGVPGVDSYSYTAPGAAWVVQSWLASVSYGVADRLAGGAGIRLLGGVLAGVVAAGVWRLTRPAGALVGRVAIASLVLVVGGTMWTSRPFMFGLACLVAVLVTLEEPRAPLWTLVPVMWIWTNAHGSYPLGLVAVGVGLVGMRLDGGDVSRHWRVLAWSSAGVAAGAIGPLGVRVFTFPVALLGKNDLLQRVIEWQSPSFAQGYARVFLVQVVLAIVLVVRRPSWRATLALVVFLIAALLAVRNISVAAIVLVPAMASCWTRLGSIDGRERGRAITVVCVLVAGLGTAGLCSYAAASPAYDLSTYPVDALAHVVATSAPGSDGCRLLVDDTNGNFVELLYGLGPAERIPVFLDDRYDMFPAAVVQDFLRFHGADPGVREALDRWQVNQVLWGRAQPLSQVLLEDERWRVSYSDDKWLVLERRSADQACRR